MCVHLSACRRPNDPGLAQEARSPADPDSCRVEFLTALDDLRLDRFVRLYVDNPHLVIAGDHAAVTGPMVFLVRDSSPDERPGMHRGPYSIALGATMDSTGTLASVIALPEGARRLGGTPLLSLMNPDHISVVWRNHVIHGSDTTASLKAARWSSGVWSADTSLIEGVGNELLNPTYTAPPAPSAEGWWSYAAFVAGRRARSIMLRDRGRGWEVDSVEWRFLVEPAVASIGTDHLLVGLVGREPHGNTIVGWPLRSRGAAGLEESRISSTDQKSVQKARVFTVDNSYFLATWTGTRDSVENTFFTAVSRDSGRTWKPAAEHRVGGAILSWAASTDAAGRVHVAANMLSSPGADGYTTHYLVLDAGHRRWSDLWRAGDSLSSIGSPAIALFNDQSSLLMFNTQARDASRTFHTYRARFRVVCSS